MIEDNQPNRLLSFIFLTVLLILIFFIPFWLISGMKGASQWPGILRYSWIISMFIAVGLANRYVYGKEI